VNTTGPGADPEAPSVERAFALLRQGLLDQAEHHLIASLERLREGADMERLMRCHAGLGQVAGRRGALARAVDHLERARALALRHHLDPRTTLIDLGMVLMRLGALDDAAELLTEAIQIHRRHGQTTFLVQAANNLGHAHLRAGRPAEARAPFELALSAPRAPTVERSQAGALAGTVVSNVELGRPGAARTVLRELERRVQPLEDPWFQAMFQWARARVRDLEGHEGALDDALACLQHARELGAIDEEILTLELLARLHAQRGDHEAAYSHQLLASERARERDRSRLDDTRILAQARRRIREEERRNVALAQTNAELQRALHTLRVQAAELAQARDAAADVAELRRWFLTVISHELRTPVNGILGASLLMLEHAQGEQADLLAVVRHCGELMLAMVDDLLDAARLEAGMLELEAVPFEVVDMVRSTLSLVRPAADHKDLRLELYLDQGVPKEVRSDARRLRQILLNLVGNAVKFTDQGTVRVRIESASAPHGDELRLIVDDSGPGIPPQDRERVLLAFEQVEGGTRRRHQGAGLGLAIASQMAALFGGSLEIDQAPLGGARLILTVPVDVLDRTPIARRPVHLELQGRDLDEVPSWLDPSTPPPDDHRADDSGQDALQEEPGVRAPRVLMVDDDPVCRFVQSAMLTRLGAQVHVAPGGTAAVASYRERADAEPDRPAFDLVLLDWMMPEFDGPAVAEHLRREGYNGPILAVTANASEVQAAKAHQTGIEQVLAKPVRPDDLRRALETWSRSEPQR